MLEDCSEEEYRRVVDINQVGTFLGMKSVIASMKQTGNASIINVSSVNGFRGAAGYSAYDSSKFAVRGMTKSAALEWATSGVRVNSVHPGTTKTPMIEGLDQEVLAAFAATIPMKRAAEPSEMATVISFLASDDASYITGTELAVDGGVTASN